MSDRYVPTLYCPFTSTLNPHAAAVDQQTMDWARAFGLISSEAVAQRFQAARFGWLAAYLAPRASLAALQLLSDWNTWAIIWDDVCDRPELRSQPALLARYQRAFLALLRGDASVRTTSPFAEALWNICQRLQLYASPMQMRQFITHVAEFFTGCAWEATNRAQQSSIDIATYIRMRRFTSGMYTSLKLIEIVDQIKLPITIWRHPTIGRARERATNAVCWANDIISLAQELQRGDIHNLVLILQPTQQVALTSRIAQAVALHDAEVHAFLRAERAIPTFGNHIDQQIDRYTTLLRSFMYGNLAWSALSGRYGLEQDAQAYALGESYAPAGRPRHEALMRATY